MQRKFWKTRGLIVLGAVLALVVAIACAADKPAAPAQPAAPLPAAPAAEAAFPSDSAAPAPAPAAQQLPAAAAPAAAPRPAAVPEPPVLVPQVSTAPLARTGSDLTTAAEDFKYVAEKAPPGGYLSYIWDGPLPVNLKESPMSAELVKQGNLLPLEQRIPTGDDTLVIPPTDEIGVYGGTIRNIAGRIGSIYSANGFILIDNDQFGRIPFLAKSWGLSDDGRVYTFTLRKNLRWGDGYPLTMEDVRFAVEDMVLNPDLVSLPNYFKSPFSGTPMDFQIVDDTTFTITYAEPYYTLMESRDGPRFMLVTRCPRCVYAPAHVLKRYHLKYNEKEINDVLLAKYDQPSWQKLLSRSGKVIPLNWMPEGDPLAAQIPKVFDPDYIYQGDMYFPYPGGLLKVVTEEGKLEATRNHYFPGVDPEGNQLPYVDGQVTFAMESRDVAVFRSMNGETDLHGGDMILSELPLYMANMEKGDYSIHRYFSAGGTDYTIHTSQEFVQDAEIGSLLRTRDFRKALSLGWNREKTNDVIMSGIGTVQNWVPHPATPYYPGEHYATLDTEHDPEAAKALLKQLGYEDRDGDGYVERKDGGGPLTMLFMAPENVYGQHFAVAELLQSHWKEIGIRLKLKEGRPRGIGRDPITEYFALGGDFYAVNPWFVSWTRLVPITTGAYMAPKIGQYVQTRGQEGMAPTGPDPAFTDAYGNMAAINTYPADITGHITKLQDVFLEGPSMPELTPRRIELGKEIFRINAEEKYNIGGLAFAGSARGIRFKRNNFRNVPKNHYAYGTETFWETNYFEDGIDNLNHPGNRSKRYSSVSFMDTNYWN